METTQRHQLEAALLAAFDTEGLRQLTRFVLDLNSALPQPARGALSAAQKARLLTFVVRARYIEGA